METQMGFYSFRFGEMKVAQADAASAKLMVVEMTFGFITPEQNTVETIELTVHVLHDAERSVGATEEEAYSRAQQLLREAADYCIARNAKQLTEEAEKNRAFNIGSG
jgi:hypothetical protein